MSDPAANAAADTTAAAAATTTPAAAPTGGDAPAPKWYEGEAFTAEERDWMKARGLQADDPLSILPKVIKGHRSAEQRIGKGLDSIMDRPAEGQKLTEWLKANGATLGLPADETGYEVKPPESWPKDLAWNGELEAQARKIAFDAGVPPDVHGAYVGLFADHMASLERASTEGMTKAREAMMSDLQRDFGDQMQAKITQAQQAAGVFFQAAGIGPEQQASVTQLLTDKTGDAGVIKLFAAIGAAMGEDRGVGLGSGGNLGMTAAEAKAELARFEAPDGEYGKAFIARDLNKLKALAPRREQLTRLATQ